MDARFAAIFAAENEILKSKIEGRISKQNDVPVTPSRRDPKMNGTSQACLRRNQKQ
jgi:hypothetical protein